MTKYILHTINCIAVIAVMVITVKSSLYKFESLTSPKNYFNSKSIWDLIRISLQRFHRY